MNVNDRMAIADRYRKRLEYLGDVPGALGEPKCRQSFYYHFLLDSPAVAEAKSILDIGCGYGDLQCYLARRGWRGRYVGIDIVAELVEAGRKRYPHADLRCLDVQEEELHESFDWAVAVSSLTVCLEHVDYYDHIEAMIGAVWKRVNLGFSFNLFSPYVDFQSPVHFHPDIGRICDIVSRFTRRFVVRNDFMPYEYAVYMYRDDAIDRSLSIFSAHKSVFDNYKNESYGDVI